MNVELSPKVFLGMGAAAVVIVGCLIYFLRASDPASRPPVPYQKFDYGAHMQEQMRQFNRQPPSASSPPQPSSPAAP